MNAGTLTLGPLEEQMRHLSSPLTLCLYIRDSNGVKKYQLGSIANFTFGIASYHAETPKGSEGKKES